MKRLAWGTAIALLGAVSAVHSQEPSSLRIGAPAQGGNIVAIDRDGFQPAPPAQAAYFAGPGYRYNPWGYVVRAGAEASPAEALHPPCAPAEGCGASCPDCFAAPGAAPGRCWGRLEYLMWWVEGADLPPLVTASPPGTSLADAGALGAPGTSVLFGGTTSNGDLRSGVRVDVGSWFDSARTCGVEARFFVLESQAALFAAGSDGTAIIARPFTDATTGLPSSELVSFPGIVAGTLTAEAGSSGLLGADVVLRCNACCTCSCRVDFTGGFRFLAYDESVRVAETLLSLDPLLPGTRFDIADSFQTSNRFYGGDIGVVAEWRGGNWSMEVLGRLALGGLHRTVTIEGNTVITEPGLPPTLNTGGLLALATNIGTYQSDEFVVIPELGLTLGYQLTPALRASLGYTFLYITDVARAADQVNLVVNPNFLPPPIGGGLAQPAFDFREENLWVQGINFGLEFRF